MFKNMKMNKAKRLLKKRIKIMVKKGVKKEDIIKKAEKVGWPKKTIEEILENIKEKKKDEIKIRVPILKKKNKEDKPKEPEKPKETIEEVKEPEIVKETPKKGLLGQIEELNEKMDIISEKGKQESKLKKKKFKLPFKVKSQLKKLAVRNKVQVMLLKRTRAIQPIIGDIRDGMLLVNGMVYNGSIDSTWLWEGKIPTMIVPEWDLQPLTPEGIDEMKATKGLTAEALKTYCLQFGRSSVPGKIIIRMIEAKENQMLKGKANAKAIIITVVIVIVVMAILFSGGAV